MNQQVKTNLAQFQKPAIAKTRVWNSTLVEDCIRKIENGDILQGGTPFHEGDIDFRSADIIYEYSEEEIKEIARCANDIVYFANKYCVSMTDEGIRKITLRPYQEDILRHYQNNRWIVFLASRQIGKTVMTGIFIAWYILFNIDKNVMILANKGATASEIVDKVKTVIKGLPFFLKPGLTQNNVMSMRFDNGCRIMSQSTTKTAAIGFTIHLLFMDEFAHIHNNFIEPFYRSVYPTLSSSNVSRVIITSTANGRNKFWEIYTNAMKPLGEEGKNEYAPFRVDWWQVPGRDDAWKAREIANLGSEEQFNQEYGNQFTASDTLLLSPDSLQYLRKIVCKYVHKEIEEFEFEDIDYKSLTWHPKFNPSIDITEKDKFFFTIDLADGIGRDYSVINIFKIEEMSKAAIRKLRKDRIEDERSFYRLRQIGLFRSNRAAVEDVAKLAEILFFKVFKPENIKIGLEMNFKGDFFVLNLKKNEDFYDEIFLHTRHSERVKYASLGIKLGPHNKMHFCRDLRRLIIEKRVILTEENTFNEMSSFGINRKGSYSSQSGYDDIAMTSVYCSTFMGTDDFLYHIEDIIDSSPDWFKQAIFSAIEKTAGEEENNYSIMKEFM
jgi:hypothetical protein